MIQLGVRKTSKYVDRCPTWEVQEMLFPIDFSVRIRGIMITSLSQISGGGCCTSQLNFKKLTAYLESKIRPFSFVKKIARVILKHKDD